MPNKRHNKLWRLGLGALAIALSLLLAWVLLPKVQVQISSEQFACYLAQGKFSLAWQHSVEKQQWQEHYAVQQQQLILVSTQFKTFGAGTPSSGKLIPSNDGWLHFAVQQRMPEINWAVSRNVQSSIINQQGQWPIYQQLADYSQVHIQVTQLPRWQYFTQEACDDYFK